MRLAMAELTPLPLPLLLLLLIGSSEAGLVQRHFREVLQLPEPLAVTSVDLRKDQIPVTIIQDELPAAQPDPANALTAGRVEAAAKNPQIATTIGEVAAPAVEAQQAIAETAAIAEDIVKAVEQEQQLRVEGAVAEAERLRDEQLVQQEIRQVIADENKELLQAVTAAEPQQQQQQQPQAIAPTIDVALETQQQQQLNTQVVPVQKPIATPVAVVALEKQQLPAEPQPIALGEIDDNLKAVPAATPQLSAANEPLEILESLSVRQATQATPTQQSTTQPNLVQQLIQNSPLGQFINQLTGQNQPGVQQQQPLAGQVAADEPATPAPTLPGFLNPQNAITSAQQAVQNAAQTVVNSTTQAFQGLQQFANNLGTQFQNTLSSLGGQNQLSSPDSTTPRPPGPFQSIISNFVGGNNPPQGSGGSVVAVAPGQPAAPGPLQGIFSFFQGGNRPQNSGGAVAVLTPSAAATQSAAVESVDNLPPAQIDNKVDVKNDEQLDVQSEIADQAAAAAPAELETDATNEVRNSAEVGADSFEDAQPDELIVVNDDAGQQQDEVVA